MEGNSWKILIYSGEGGKSLQTVMILCSERWEQGRELLLAGRELQHGAVSSLGPPLPSRASQPPSIFPAFLHPGPALAALGPLFPVQMAAAAQPRAASRGGRTPGCSALLRLRAARILSRQQGGGLPVPGTPLWLRERASTRRSQRDNSHRAPNAPCGPGHGRRGNPRLVIWGGLGKTARGKEGEQQLRAEHVGAVMAFGSRDIWRR